MAENEKKEELDNKKELENQERYKRIQTKIQKIIEEEKIEILLCTIQYKEDTNVDMIIHGESLMKLAKLSASAAKSIKTLLKAQISKNIDQELEI